jgi:hypothetical protein
VGSPRAMRSAPSTTKPCSSSPPLSSGSNAEGLSSVSSTTR